MKISLAFGLNINIIKKDKVKGWRFFFGLCPFEFLLLGMSHKNRRKKMYIAWVIITILAVVSMIGFLFAPLITRY